MGPEKIEEYMRQVAAMEQREREQAAAERERLAAAEAALEVC